MVTVVSVGGTGTVVGGGGAIVVTGGAVVTGRCVGTVVTGRGVVEVEVEVVSVVDVRPYAPLYWYWPCQDVHSGVPVADTNGTSARLPIAAPMYVCQICAGNVGPDTAMPCTLSIGISALG